MQPTGNQDEEWRVRVDPADAGTRLDAVLARALDGFSRNRIKELILAGAVAVNEKTIGEPKFKVKPGDDLRLVAPPPEDPAPLPEPIPLDVLYQDKALIVVNKPAGLVVHPAPGTPTGTLVNALLYHCGPSLPGINGVRRPGIVHRLDKDTSGVMVVARTLEALNDLAAQFADHGRTGPLERVYTAFVWGRAEAHTGTIDAPLGRDAANRLKQAVRRDGRPAVTHYRATARFGAEGWDITELDCALETGRTHQIRVHMAHIGHPLVADPLYASGYATKSNRLPEALKNVVDGLGRQALHARVLGFKHPETGETMRFETPLPPDLREFAGALAPFDRAAGRKPDQIAR